MWTKIALAIVCAGLLLMECANATGGSTETSSKVAGILYNDDGTRAAGAKVACIPRNHNPYDGSHSGGDSTFTDDTGAYKFKTMAADTYDIISSKDISMAFRDPVVVTNDKNTDVPHDTLKPAGSIRGVVRFEEGGDMSTVFILFFGTRTFTWPDDSLGNFTSGLMPRGKYRVRVLTTTPEYQYANDTFDVRAGMNDVLPDTIVLKYTGIPVPRNLQIQYDTMKQIVTLTWNRPVSGRPLLGYNIYRKHQDSTQTLLRGNWQDTVYHDSTGIQDITYEYRVAAIDTNTTEGTRSTAVSVTVLSAFVVIDTIGEGRGLIGGLLDNLRDIVVRQDGRIYVTDDTIGLKIFDSNGTYSSTLPCSLFTGPNIKRVLKMAMDANDNLYITGMANNAYTGNGIVIKLNSQDSLLMSFGNRGTGDSLLGFPMSIAVFDTIAFVENTDDRYVKTYSVNTGNYMYSFGGAGTGSGQFVEIKGLDVNALGEIAVCEATRVQRFDVNGAILGSFNINLGVPSSLRYNHDDEIYIVSITNDRIYGFTTAGQIFATFAVRNEPSSLFIDNQGSSFVGYYRQGIFEKYR